MLLRNPGVAVLAVLLGPVVAGNGLVAQTAGPRGMEVGALPAINFDSDEGFGFGAIAELYQYGEGVSDPYVWTIQPAFFFTTEGRRDFTVLFDAPHLLSGGWRLSGVVGRTKQIATPYYGVGNATTFDELLSSDDGPDPYYYRFGLVRNRLTFDLQRSVEGWPVRLLVGGGFERATAVPVPEEEGTTLYAQQVGAVEEDVWLNFLRAGIVWDTRDRETGPTAGAWTDLLIRASDESLAADVSFVRWTFTDRRYFTLTDGLVLAHRYLLQNVTTGTPALELSRVQTSFKRQEGLGGATTLRGLPRNRYLGRGMLVWNAELRWRASEFGAVGRSFHVVLSAFLDQGRVWADGLEIGEVFQDLHRGYGGGVRVGMGENFVVAMDVGTSKGAGLGLYTGLGYLY